MSLPTQTPAIMADNGCFYLFQVRVQPAVVELGRGKGEVSLVCLFLESYISCFKYF